MTYECKCGNPAKVTVDNEGLCWYCYRKLRNLSLDLAYKPDDEVWEKER